MFGFIQKSANVSEETQKLEQLYKHRIKTHFKNCLENFAFLNEYIDNLGQEKIFLKKQQTRVCINSFNILMGAMQEEIQSNDYLQEQIRILFNDEIIPRFKKIKNKINDISREEADALERICLNQNCMLLEVSRLELPQCNFQSTVNNLIIEKDREERDRQYIFQNRKYPPETVYQARIENERMSSDFPKEIDHSYNCQNVNEKYEKSNNQFTDYKQENK